MLKLEDFKKNEIFSFKTLTGGADYAWRDGSSYSYSGTTSSHDEENVTTFSSYVEARNAGCDTLSCIDQAYDCGDDMLLFG